MILAKTKTVFKSKTVWSDLATILGGVVGLFGYFHSVERDSTILTGSLSAIACGVAGIYFRISSKSIIIPFLKTSNNGVKTMTDPNIASIAAAIETQGGAALGSFLSSKLTPEKRDQYAKVIGNIALGLTGLAVIAAGVTNALNAAATTSTKSTAATPAKTV